MILPSLCYHCAAATATTTTAARKKTRTSIGNAVDLKMRLDYTFRCDFIVLMKRSNVLIMKNSLFPTKWRNGIETWIQRNSIYETVPAKQTVPTEKLSQNNSLRSNFSINNLVTFNLMTTIAKNANLFQAWAFPELSLPATVIFNWTFSEINISLTRIFILLINLLPQKVRT